MTVHWTNKAIGPRFCSMRISEDIRNLGAAELAELANAAKG